MIVKNTTADMGFYDISGKNNQQQINLIIINWNTMSHCFVQEFVLFSEDNNYDPF